MKMPGLPVSGWCYCPRCDKESMIAVVEGKEWECPFCGLGMAVTYQDGNKVGIEATKIMTVDEAARYQAYLITMVRKQEQEIYNPPWRVRLCFKLFSIVGWLFGCKPHVIVDKRKKEEAGEGKAK